VKTEEIIKQALKEDLGPGDVTVEALVPPALKGVARIVAKQAGIVAGVGVAAAVFEAADPQVVVTKIADSGDTVKPGQAILEIHGRAGSLLKAERTALNFLQHLSGIATQTGRFVAAVEGTGAVILDTRKTTPGLRLLEKEAVKAGGGENHRMGLHDLVLVKDNHLAMLGCKNEAEAVEKAIAKARAGVPAGMQIEVEVTTLKGALAAAQADAEMILLDNMTLEEMNTTVQQVGAECGRRRPLLEASGGVTLETVLAVAETGVDRISVGGLTHSVKALDIAMYLDID